MATDKKAAGKAAAKRPKTGGRAAKPTLAQQMETGRARAEISSWNDDTTLETPLAALYLGVSEKLLKKMRAPSKDGKPAGPPIIKNIHAGAVGMNQPVFYKLGDLREFQQGIKASDVFDAAVKAGLAGWTTNRHPFFAEAGTRGRLSIAADAWDRSDPRREERFAALVKGEASIAWMSPAEAATSRWLDPDAHARFAKKGQELLRDELQAIEAAALGSELNKVAAEAKPSEQSRVR